MNQYCHVAKMLLRNIYCTLLNNEAASSSAMVAKMDECVAQAVVSVDDPDSARLTYLRKASGNPKFTTFDRL